CIPNIDRRQHFMARQPQYTSYAALQPQTYSPGAAPETSSLLFFPALLITGYPVVAIIHTLLSLPPDGGHALSAFYRVAMVVYCWYIGLRFINEKRVS